MKVATLPFPSGTLGFISSTALIVIFGEILPQAACSRYALCELLHLPVSVKESFGWSQLPLLRTRTSLGSPPT